MHRDSLIEERNWAGEREDFENLGNPAGGARNQGNRTGETEDLPFPNVVVGIEEETLGVRYAAELRRRLAVLDGREPDMSVGPVGMETESPSGKAWLPR